MEPSTVREVRYFTCKSGHQHETAEEALSCEGQLQYEQDIYERLYIPITINLSVSDDDMKKVEAHWFETQEEIEIYLKHHKPDRKCEWQGPGVYYIDRWSEDHDGIDHYWKLTKLDIERTIKNVTYEIAELNCDIDRAKNIITTLSDGNFTETVRNRFKKANGDYILWYNSTTVTWDMISEPASYTKTEKVRDEHRSQLYHAHQTKGGWLFVEPVYKILLVGMTPEGEK